MRHDEHGDVLRSVPVSVTTSICASLAVSVLALAASTLAMAAYPSSHSPPPPSPSPPPSVALVSTALSVPSNQDGELVLRGAARCAAADDHQGERTVLSLAYEDEEPAGHVRCLEGGSRGAACCWR